MRRIILFLSLVLSLCAYLVPVAWAQQASVPRFSRHRISGHGRSIAIPSKSGMTSHPSVSAETGPACNTRVWDLGTFPGGSWAEAGGINDSGVMVAQGDADSTGDNHLFSVRFSGPRGPQWSDLGSVGANEGWFLWPEIADTGMVAGYAATGDGYVHALAWTERSGRVDLGTLSDLGYPFSVAERVNKLGTLIVGWSGSTSDNSTASLPVVWTPRLTRKPDGMTIVWKIQGLDTTGLEGFHHWMATGVNDMGQISGIAWDDSDPENDVGVI